MQYLVIFAFSNYVPEYNVMRRMKKQWLRCLNYLLAVMLLLLGFPSCLDENNPDMPLEYGQPHAKYAIKGKVVNEKNEIVSDIQLIIKGLVQTTYSENVFTSDTLYSNTDGNFEFADEFAYPNTKYKIIHRDIDKEGNIRKYKTDSILVTMPKPDGASGNWYEGFASAEVTIILKEKPTENNN